jgi:hypothetical protein
MRARLREFLQGSKYIEHGGVTVRILAPRHGLRLLAQGAAVDIGEQLEQAVRRLAERNSIACVAPRIATT